MRTTRMSGLRKLVGSAMLTALCAFAATVVPSAEAAPALRFQTDQRGDMLLIGNTLGYDCRTDIMLPKPMLGTVGMCGVNGLDDSAPDIFWRADDPAPGQARADITIPPESARTSAVLKLPAGAQVTYARLYWGGLIAEDPIVAQSPVLLDRPGSTKPFSQMVKPLPADAVAKLGGGAGLVYQASADITKLVQTYGEGIYRLTDVARRSVVNIEGDVQFAAWSIIVVYKRDQDPIRNIAIFDGLEPVVGGAKVEFTLNGLNVPAGTPSGKLAVIGYEGDPEKLDSLKFNGATLTDAQNPATDFFNSSRSNLGTPVSVVGDLPQLAGTAGSMSGLDLDTVDISSLVKPGDTTATVTAESVSDIYILGMLATAIQSKKPIIDTVLTTPPGTSTRPGDVVEFTSTSKNIGDDIGSGVVIEHKLPPGVSYVPGSVKFVDGPEAGQNGPKTDSIGDDQVDFDPATGILRIRIGKGANGNQGGTLDPTDKPVVIKYQVKIDDNAVGEIPTQSTTTATSGSNPGSGSTSFPSGNGTTPNSPTVISVPPCMGNIDCTVGSPVCDVKAMPARCSSTCTSDADCKGAPGGTEVCSPANKCVQCSPTAKSACAPEGPGTQCLPSGACGCMTDADCGGRTCNVATNTCPKPTADLTVNVKHEILPPQEGQPPKAKYTIDVTNKGPAGAPGPTTVSYDLPQGGGKIDSVDPGPGWRCMVVDRTVNCTRTQPIAAGSTTPSIVITLVQDPTSGSGGNGGTPGGAVRVKVVADSTGSTDPNPADNTFAEDLTFANYRVAGGGFGCTLSGSSSSASLWGSAAMAMACFAVLARRRRSKVER